MLSREKIYEHRRFFPNEPVTAYIYISRPVQALAGILYLDNKVNIEDWKEKYLYDPATLKRIDKYLKHHIVAMEIKKFQNTTQIPLAEIRKEFPDFLIPKMYYYLDDLPLLDYLRQHQKEVGQLITHGFENITSDKICVCSLTRRIKMSKKKRVLSLFSVCGGMNIGFEGGFRYLKRSINTEIHPNWIKEDLGEWVNVTETGFETVFANDIRPDAKAAWVSYFGNIYENANDIYHVESVVDLVKRAQAGEKVFSGDIDIVTGRFPCQDFSVAGKRKGFNSDESHNGGKLEVDEPTVGNRGQLYMWMKEVIEHDFVNAAYGGYLVIPARVLHAANYGVPQSRERVIFYGFKRKALKRSALASLLDLENNMEFDPYPPPTHAYNVEGVCAPFFLLV